MRYTTQLPDEEEEQNNTQLGIRLALVGLAGGLGLLQALLQNRQRRDQTRMWCDGQRQDRGGMRWGRQRQEQRGMRWGRGQARKQSGGLGGILATLGKTQDILLGSVGIAQGILDTTQGVFSSGMGTAQDVFSNGMDTAQDVMARNAKQARKNWKRTQKNLGRNMTRTQYTLGEHSRRVGGHLWNAASTVYGLPGNVGGALGEGSRRAGRHIWNTATNVYSFPGNARERYARQACRQARARRLFDWGLAIGAVVAMLYAPIPGSELRRRLVSQWQQYNTYRAA
ncbi:MAG TPA: YtxH domain-containing protein [Ktedonosporobacter sp.]|nr:YtxH domain-containing protein [Ktedonosporobacter sp.]